MKIQANSLSFSLFYSLSTINTRVIGPFFSNIIISHFSKNWKLVFKLAKRGGRGGEFNTSVHSNSLYGHGKFERKLELRILNELLLNYHAVPSMLFSYFIPPIFRTRLRINFPKLFLLSFSLSFFVSFRSKYCFVPFFTSV